MADYALLEVDRGAGNSWTITPRRAGQAITLTGSETLAATVHRGGTRSVVFAPTVAPSAGKVLLSVSGAQTTALDGLYVVRLSIDQVSIRIGRLKVLGTPGATAIRPVYATLDDVRRLASTWLDALFSEYDELDLNPQLADARQALEERILERLPDWRRATIATHLAANRLVVTQRVREITARYALAWLCEGQMAGTKEEDDAWRERATWQHTRIRELLNGFNAAIDTDGDGTADLFPSTSTPMRIVR